MAINGKTLEEADRTPAMRIRLLGMAVEELRYANQHLQNIEDKLDQINATLIAFPGPPHE